MRTSIEYVKGVGPQRAETFKKEVGIFSVSDLLEYYPFRYIDRSKVHSIAAINEDQTYIQLKGRLTSITEAGKPRSKRLVALLEDDSGTIELVWFKGIKWVKPNLKEGKEYVVFGRPSRYGSKWNIAHPDLELIPSGASLKDRGLQPVYSTTEKLSSKGLHSKGIEKIMKGLVAELEGKISDPVPKEVIAELNLPSREQAIRDIHFPGSQDALLQARFRIKFEELLYVQLQILLLRVSHSRKYQGHVFSKVGDQFTDYYNNCLKFELTGAQKRVLKEIRRDLNEGQHMNRLLQGDVGSGKTLVALLSMLLAVDNGFQAALMAPTEILATQHYHTIRDELKTLPVYVALLTGSTSKADREQIHAGLQSGELHILIGTHALLEDPVKYKNLGLAVIDEQHRFGVAQRARMWKKNTTPPHILVMTATPIPRTLAMTLYGDLDVSIIDEMPPGRKPVRTELRYEKNRLRVYQFVENEIKKGRQVYIVYPLIEESEKLDLASLTEGFEAVKRRFPLPDYKVSIVHGRMAPTDKDLEMQRFVEGETQIMVATTVIEVGVNVPNASVMIIENAERFGLSQLHQLRGRVGRGADQSYCILMAGQKVSKEGKERLQVMCETNDGFRIAEEDMKLRGPGDMMGTRQSGSLEFKLANLVTDGPILSRARKAAIQILKEDPELKLDKHQSLAFHLMEVLKKRASWSQIS